MITLSIIIYIIISLIIAWRKFENYEFDNDTGKLSTYYGNGKKSLIYGFLFLPTLIISVYAGVMIITGLGSIISSFIKWILTNMP